MGLIVPSIVKEIIYFSFLFFFYFYAFSFALGGGASASLALWGTHPNLSYLLTVNNIPKEAARTKCGSVRLCSSPTVLIMVNTFISPLMKRRMSSVQFLLMSLWFRSIMWPGFVITWSDLCHVCSWRRLGGFCCMLGHFSPCKGGPTVVYKYIL